MSATTRFRVKASSCPSCPGVSRRSRPRVTRNRRARSHVRNRELYRLWSSRWQTPCPLAAPAPFPERSWGPSISSSRPRLAVVGPFVLSGLAGWASCRPSFPFPCQSFPYVCPYQGQSLRRPYRRPARRHRSRPAGHRAAWRRLERGKPRRAAAQLSAHTLRSRCPACPGVRGGSRGWRTQGGPLRRALPSLGDAFSCQRCCSAGRTCLAGSWARPGPVGHQCHRRGSLVAPLDLCGVGAAGGAGVRSPPGRPQPDHALAVSQLFLGARRPLTLSSRRPAVAPGCETAHGCPLPLSWSLPMPLVSRAAGTAGAGRLVSAVVLGSDAQRRHI